MFLPNRAIPVYFGQVIADKRSLSACGPAVSSHHQLKPSSATLRRKDEGFKPQERGNSIQTQRCTASKRSFSDYWVGEKSPKQHPTALSHQREKKKKDYWKKLSCLYFASLSYLTTPEFLFQRYGTELTDTTEVLIPGSECIFLLGNK